MIYTLAIVPSIILLVYIYKKDRKDKEPVRLLLKCFIYGIVIILPAVIMETVMDIILDECFVAGSIPYALIDGFIVAGLSEELCKYVALKKATWKSREFNCTFDGIVYAVFVSLGFATFENIFYILDGGLSIAVMRMFTAVPGHAYFAVLMGYFYSKAKGAELVGDLALARKNKRLALVCPIMFHGIYDSLIMLEEEVVGSVVIALAFLLWLGAVIYEFVTSLRIVRKASKDDNYFPIPVSEVVLEEAGTGLQEGTACDSQEN